MAARRRAAARRRPAVHQPVDPLRRFGLFGLVGFFSRGIGLVVGVVVLVVRMEGILVDGILVEWILAPKRVVKR